MIYRYVLLIPGRQYIAEHYLYQMLQFCYMHNLLSNLLSSVEHSYTHTLIYF